MTTQMIKFQWFENVFSGAKESHEIVTIDGIFDHMYLSGLQSQNQFNW